MSYNNGINTLQQLFTQMDTANVSQTQQVTASNAGSETKAAVASGSASAPSDQASLSTLGGLAAQSAGGDDVRMDKVMSLQAAINDGSYSVSAASVADSLMSHMLG